MAHASLPKSPGIHTTSSRESFIRPSTVERLAFERLIINMLPEWDDPQPLRLPRQRFPATRLAMIGLGLAVSIGAIVILSRRRQ